MAGPGKVQTSAGTRNLHLPARSRHIRHAEGNRTPLKHRPPNIHQDPIAQFYGIIQAQDCHLCSPALRRILKQALPAKRRLRILANGFNRESSPLPHLPTPHARDRRSRLKKQRSGSCEIVQPPDLEDMCSSPTSSAHPRKCRTCEQP